VSKQELGRVLHVRFASFVRVEKPGGSEDTDWIDIKRGDHQAVEVDLGRGFLTVRSTATGIENPRTIYVPLSNVRYLAVAP
jgi:hypothetical protein